MTREQLTEKIVAQRIAKGLTWKAIARELGESSEIIYTPRCWGR